MWQDALIYQIDDQRDDLRANAQWQKEYFAAVGHLQQQKRNAEDDPCLGLIRQ